MATAHQRGDRRNDFARTSRAISRSCPVVGLSLACKRRTMLHVSVAASEGHCSSHWPPLICCGALKSRGHQKFPASWSSLMCTFIVSLSSDKLAQRTQEVQRLFRSHPCLEVFKRPMHRRVVQVVWAPYDRSKADFSRSLLIEILCVICMGSRRTNSVGGPTQAGARGPEAERIRLRGSTFESMDRYGPNKSR